MDNTTDLLDNDWVIVDHYDITNQTDQTDQKDTQMVQTNQKDTQMVQKDTQMDQMDQKDTHTDQINQINQKDPQTDTQSNNINKIDKRFIDFITTNMPFGSIFINSRNINVLFLQNICTNNDKPVYYSKEFFVMLARFVERVPIEYGICVINQIINKILCENLTQDDLTNKCNHDLFNDFYYEYVRVYIYCFCYIPNSYLTQELINSCQHIKTLMLSDLHNPYNNHICTHTLGFYKFA